MWHLLSSHKSQRPLYIPATSHVASPTTLRLLRAPREYRRASRVAAQRQPKAVNGYTYICIKSEFRSPHTCPQNHHSPYAFSQHNPKSLFLPDSARCPLDIKYCGLSSAHGRHQPHGLVVVVAAVAPGVPADPVASVAKEGAASNC